MSDSPSPAIFNAFGTASTGPTPIISGSTPATAKDRNLTSGVNPSASAFSRSITKTDDAQSLISEEFSAVTVHLVLHAVRTYQISYIVGTERTPTFVTM